MHIREQKGLPGACRHKPWLTRRGSAFVKKQAQKKTKKKKTELFFLLRCWFARTICVMFLGHLHSQLETEIPQLRHFQNRSPSQNKHTKEPNTMKCTRKNTITSLMHNVFRIRKEEMLRAQPRSMISWDASSKVLAVACVLQDLCCAQPSARSLEQGQAGGRRENPFHTECNLPHKGNAGVPSHLNPGPLNSWLGLNLFHTECPVD